MMFRLQFTDRPKNQCIRLAALTCCICLQLGTIALAGCQAVKPRASITLDSGSIAADNSSGDQAKPDVDSVAQATLNRYRTGEVQEYQGMRLDPAIGPSDNSIKGIQDVDISTYKLSIEGLVQKPVQLSYDQVLELDAYERLITLHCVEGWDATVLWKGVLIKDLIKQAGGAKDTAKTVIFHSVDGYTTSLSLYNIQNRDTILAYDSNGLTLPPALGYPFIVVAENKFGYKWARWVNAIELSDDESYRGYWEERGYDNNGSIYEE